MKKKYLLLLLPLLLAGCAEKPAETPIENNTDGSLSIMTPTGAPAVVLSSFISDPKFEPTNNPQTIIAQMVKEQVDIAVLPTNVGVQQIVAKGLNYKIASTITFGNLFIVSSGTDDDNVMDETDDIVLFGKGSVPHKVFQTVYNIDVPDDKFKGTSGDIKNMIKLQTESFEYALIAEPDLSSLETQLGIDIVYDNVQAAYKNKFSEKEIFQASIFVKNGLDSVSVDSYLNAINQYANKLLANPSLLQSVLATDATAETTLGINVNDAITSINKNNSLGIGYKKAFEHKAEIDTFLSIFEMPATNEEIYYK